MTRQQLLDEAVKRVYPFRLMAGPPIAGVQRIRRVYDNDQFILEDRQYIVEAVRMEFRRLQLSGISPLMRGP